jgi:hypothetical protein
MPKTPLDFGMQIRSQASKDLGLLELSNFPQTPILLDLSNNFNGSISEFKSAKVESWKRVENGLGQYDSPIKGKERRSGSKTMINPRIKWTKIMDVRPA